MTVIPFGNKSCEEVRQYLDSYLDGELLVETSHDIRTHLDNCRACAEVLAVRQSVKRLLQRAVRAQMGGEDLKEKIQRQIRRMDRREHLLARSRRWAVAAAAFFFMLFGGWAAIQYFSTRSSVDRTSRGTVPPALTEQATAVLKLGLSDHVHCALRREFSENPPSLPELFQSMSPEYAGLVPLVAEKLPHSRVLLAHRCSVDGHEFLHVVVRQQESLVSLSVIKKNGLSFVAGKPAGDPTTPRSSIYRARLQELEVAGFETPEYLAFVVSDLAENTNYQIASDLAPSIRSFLTKLEN